MAEPQANVSQPPVLIVDDDEAVLEMLGGQITLAGYRAQAFLDPRAAFEALRHTSFAAVISDFKMPGMSGLDLLARVREIQPQAMRILVTGVLSTNSLLGSIESGLLHRFLAKPWSRVELISTVESAVQHHRLIEENGHLRAETTRLSEALQTANAKVEVLLEQLTRRDSAEAPKATRCVTSPSGLLSLGSPASQRRATCDIVRVARAE